MGLSADLLRKHLCRSLPNLLMYWERHSYLLHVRSRSVAYFDSNHKYSILMFVETTYSRQKRNHLLHFVVHYIPCISTGTYPLHLDSCLIQSVYCNFHKTHYFKLICVVLTTVKQTLAVER